MAIGMYTQPLEATYEPIPFEAITKAGIAKQGRYDQAEALMNQTIDKAYSAPAASFDQPTVQSRAAETERQVEDIITRNPDLASFEVKEELNRLIRDTAKDPFYRQTAINAQREQEMLKIINDPNIDEASKFRIRKEYDRFKDLGTESAGIISPITTPQQVDVFTGLDKISKGIVRQGIQTGNVQTDESGNIVNIKQGYQGILAEEVGSLYGFDVKTDSLGNPTSVNLDYIPDDILNSKEGQRLLMQSEASTGKLLTEDRDAVMADFTSKYEALGKRLIAKNSGLNVQQIEGLKSVAPKGKTRNGDESIRIGGNVVHIAHVPDSANKSKMAIDDYDAQIALLEKSLSENPQYAKFYNSRLVSLKQDKNEEETRISNIKTELDYNKKLRNIDEELSRKRYGISKKEWDAFTDETKDEVISETNALLNDIEYLNSEVASQAAYAKSGLGEYEIKDPERYERGRRATEEIGKRAFQKVSSAKRKVNNALDDAISKDSKNSAGKFSTIAFSKYKGVQEDLNSLFPNNKSAFTVYETSEGTENANTPLNLTNIPDVEFTNFAIDYVPNVGYVFQAKEVVEKGDKPRTFTMYSKAPGNVAQVLGRKVMAQNTKDITTFNSGFRMAYPGYAPELSKLRDNQELTLYRDMTTNEPSDPFVNVKKSKVPGTGDDIWTIDILNPDGSIFKTYDGGKIDSDKKLYLAIDRIASGKLNDNANEQ